MIPDLNYTGITISSVTIYHYPRYKYGDHGEKIQANGNRIPPQVYVGVRVLNKSKLGGVAYIPCED